MIADTSGLLAFFDAAEPRHEEVLAVVEGLSTPLAISPFVIAELDYLLMTRLGVEAELTVLAELTGGAFDIDRVHLDDLADVARVIEKYADQRLGLADAHQVVMARRLETRDILTLDRRHFEVLRPGQGGRFRIHPR